VTGNLLLVCSYPKSGNTWVRFVFEALRRGPHRAISINDMGTGLYAFWRRALFDELAPVNASELLMDEIDDLLPQVYRRAAAESGDPLIVKVHDMAFRTRSGEWLYPPDSVGCAVYLVRHPFDVAVSYAHHLNISVEAAVDMMGRSEIMAPSGPRLILPLHERVGSWSGNVGSWLDQSALPLALARYEDLHADPVAGFARLAAAAGLAAATTDVARAVEAARFDRLQQEEKSSGFSGRPRSSSQFFRVGRPRSWEGALKAGLQERLVREHGDAMARLGYAADGSVLPLPC